MKRMSISDLETERFATVQEQVAELKQAKVHQERAEQLRAHAEMLGEEIAHRILRDAA